MPLVRQSPITKVLPTTISSVITLISSPSLSFGSMGMSLKAITTVLQTSFLRHIHTLFPGSHGTQFISKPSPTLISPFDFGEEDLKSSDSDSVDKGLKLANTKEVERVYKVIEDLFASNRNMEVVLDECGIDVNPLS